MNVVLSQSMILFTHLSSIHCCSLFTFETWIMLHSITCITFLFFQEGTTPLVLSSANNHLSCVRELLKQGADPAARRLVRWSIHSLYTMLDSCYNQSWPHEEDQSARRTKSMEYHGNLPYWSVLLFILFTLKVSSGIYSLSKLNDILKSVHVYWMHQLNQIHIQLSLHID